MSVKCAALLRLSSKKQVERQAFARDTDDSLPAQREIINSFLAKHSDWQMVRWFEEAGVSAFRNMAEERDVLQEVLEGAKGGQFDKLILWRYDRLSRLTEQYQKLFADLRRYNVEVWSAEEDRPLKYESHMDKAMRFFEGFQAEAYSRAISAAVVPAMNQLAAQGHWMGGPVPFGYKLVTKINPADGQPVVVAGRTIRELVPDPDRAPAVREMFRLYLNGYGLTRVALWLNESGIKTRTGTYWTPVTVSQVLANPVSAGMVQYRKREQVPGAPGRYRKTETPILAEGKHEAIIDRDTWEATQQMREVRRATPKRQLGSDFALAGALRCGLCGGTMGGHGHSYRAKGGTKIEYRYYTCRGGKRVHRCDSKDYRAEVVEAQFLEAIEQLAMPTGLRTFLEQQAESQATHRKDLLAARKAAEERVKVIEGALQRLDRSYFEVGNISDAEYNAKKAGYHTELDQLREQLAAPVPEVAPKDFFNLAEAALQVKENWVYLEPHERKVVVMQLCANWGVTVAVLPGPKVELKPKAE